MHSTIIKCVTSLWYYNNKVVTGWKISTERLDSSTTNYGRGGWRYLVWHDLKSGKAWNMLLIKDCMSNFDIFHFPIKKNFVLTICFWNMDIYFPNTIVEKWEVVYWKEDSVSVRLEQ